MDERQWRKQRPIFSGVLRYFPDALLEVAYCSWVGNEQHNPGEPLHWAKEKSTDEADALLRHLAEAGNKDTDGVRHSAKVAWRALALLQREIEKEKVDAFNKELSAQRDASWLRERELVATTTKPNTGPVTDSVGLYASTTGACLDDLHERQGGQPPLDSIWQRSARELASRSERYHGSDLPQSVPVKGRISSDWWVEGGGNHRPPTEQARRALGERDKS
jgi:hypothetical protein